MFNPFKRQELARAFRDALAATQKALTRSRNFFAPAENKAAKKDDEVPLYQTAKGAREAASPAHGARPYLSEDPTQVQVEYTIPEGTGSGLAGTKLLFVQDRAWPYTRRVSKDPFIFPEVAEQIGYRGGEWRNSLGTFTRNWLSMRVHGSHPGVRFVRAELGQPDIDARDLPLVPVPTKKRDPLMMAALHVDLHVADIWGKPTNATWFAWMLFTVYADLKAKHDAQLSPPQDVLLPFSRQPAPRTKEEVRSDIEKYLTFPSYTLPWGLAADWAALPISVPRMQIMTVAFQMLLAIEYQGYAAHSTFERGLHKLAKAHWDKVTAGGTNVFAEHYEHTDLS